ncbi:MULTISPECIES: EamA family transporter [Pseudonocardia]|uniref:Membrane protein n=2 Tax=Pseudonocardia TaxID=1847 RepID=A0ABQ0RTP0_9PSEU|nr:MULTISPECIES: DMT family transporter [Pseudonocardia]OSY42051.1 putative inner membrane transporter YicL [Pseudonocardia autotrophica]TDN75180.1 threonine/homoserine efflux transporter RhtA [Pseudonocardia autotrophica]BBF99125.1 membrane protein [Pseudonocardia autotrophica]GEC24045.1 membrane protein [Pseudonocardia saturnea]
MSTSVVTRDHLVRGLAWALVSAAAYGFSGPLGSAFLEAGWSPGLTTLMRIAGAALLLLPVAVVLARRHRPDRAARRKIVIFGLFAVAGVQLCFFHALEYLSVGVALLLEFLAPVLLVGWTWITTRRTPSAITLAGCLVALAGLVFVVDPFGPQRVELVGILWGLASAVCVCVYFALPGGNREGQVPPLLMISGGMIVGAVSLTVTGLLGITPWKTGAPVGTLGGAELDWVLLLGMLVLLATALPYVTGILAIRRLDTRVASFVGLSEVLFGVLAAWLLVAQQPTLMQLLGGVLILGGIVLIRRAENRAAATPSEVAVEG